MCCLRHSVMALLFSCIAKKRDGKKGSNSMKQKNGVQTDGPRKCTIHIGGLSNADGILGNCYKLIVFIYA